MTDTVKGTLYRLCMEPLGWQNTGGHSDLAADGCEALFRHLSHHLPLPLLGHSLSEALVENPCCLSGPLHSPSWALQSWWVSASSSHPATAFCLGSACLAWHITALHSVNAWKENSSLFCDSLFSDTASLSDPSCPGSSNANFHLPAQSEGCHLELHFQRTCISAPDPANTLSTGAVSVEFSEPAFSLMARPPCPLLSDIVKPFFLIHVYFIQTLVLISVGEFFIHSIVVWMENVTAKQRMLQPSSHHHITAAPKARPEGTRDGD